jgi:hypothetical protein
VRLDIDGGQRIQVLLELKGHLEEALSKDMRLSRQTGTCQHRWGAPSSLDGRAGAHKQEGP